MSSKNSYKKHSYTPNRKLLAAGLLAFAATLATSVTATYAFYDLSSSATVSILNMYMDLSNEMLIGMKNPNGAIDYQEGIGSPYIASHSDAYYEGKPLDEVSGMYQSLWNNESFDPKTGFPSFRGSYQNVDGTEMPPLATDESYIQLEFFIKSSWDGYLYLGDGFSLSADHEKNLDTVNRLRSNGKLGVSVEDLDTVVNAARISFLSTESYIVLNPDPDEDTVFGGPLNIRGADQYYDFDANTGKELVYGEYLDGAQIVFDDDPLTSDLDENPDVKKDSFHAIHKAGIRKYNVDKTKEANGNRLPFRHESAYSISDLTLKEGQNYNDPSLTKPLARLESGKDTRLVVTIYLEGWDKDMTNSICYGAFNLDLEFEGLMDVIR